jgi:pyrroline-5-carboxylate reductase
MSSIACIGIGNMGAALALTLLKTTPITIWNRTTSRPQVQSVVAAGGKLDTNLRSVVESNDILIICVLDYATVSRILEQVDYSDSLAGKTVINLTNGTPKQVREATTWFQSHGVKQYFDGAVMVTPQLVGTEHSFLICSGENEAAFTAEHGISTVLKPLGHLLYIGEEAESSASYDLAALAAMYGMFSGAFIGMGLLKKQKQGQNQQGQSKTLPGVEKVVIPVLNALVPYVGLLAKSFDDETWDDNMGNPLSMQLEGVKNILLACKEEGVDGAGLEFLASTMERAVTDRGGEGGVAVVAKYLLK